MDPRLRCCSADEMQRLRDSDAVIVNIDYPLGMASYHVLAKISQYASQMRGIYVIGKAATLNARVGDVMIANVVYDEHSENSYLFGNSFSAADIIPYLTLSSVLDNQKAVSVRGTFLQNVRYMDVFYREGYSIVEMEAGPYLSAVYEMVRAQRHPVNEIVNLYIAPFDLGFLHYASDTPMTRERNLGAGRLSYLGAEPTYATAIATLRRIFRVELERIRDDLPEAHAAAGEAAVMGGSGDGSLRRDQN
jgi:glutathione S-transferase